MAELILQAIRRFTYVTAHYPTLPSLYLCHRSFSNPSVASPTSQLILQPFFRFSYVTEFSLTEPGEPPVIQPSICLDDWGKPRKKTQSGWSAPGFEPGTSRMRVSCVTMEPPRSVSVIFFRRIMHKISPVVNLAERHETLLANKWLAVCNSQLLLIFKKAVPIHLLIIHCFISLQYSENINDCIIL